MQLLNASFDAVPYQMSNSYISLFAYRYRLEIKYRSISNTNDIISALLSVLEPPTLTSSIRLDNGR